jgi:hypothetical protein
MWNRPARAKREYREEEKRSNKKKDIQRGKPRLLMVYFIPCI